MTIQLTVRQYEYFERFFQYGNLKQAKYVFVGFEEGLGQESIEHVIQSRLEFEQEVASAVEYLPERIQYRQEPGQLPAYYISDVDRAAVYTTRSSYRNYEDYRKRLPVDLTMSMQATMKLLADSDFRFLDITDKQRARRDCFFDVLHKPGSGTAMIDRYPLPKQGKFPYRVDGLFRNFDQYIAYNNRSDNRRLQILKGLYDEFPMNVSIGYAGISRGEFKLRPFYEQLGFAFERKDTSMVHPDYEGVVTPVLQKPKPFLVGVRERTGQKAILTPFFGMGQMSYDDLYVIATWAIER